MQNAGVVSHVSSQLRFLTYACVLHFVRELQKKKNVFKQIGEVRSFWSAVLVDEKVASLELYSSLRSSNIHIFFKFSVNNLEYL